MAVEKSYLKQRRRITLRREVKVGVYRTKILKTEPASPLGETKVYLASMKKLYCCPSGNEWGFDVNKMRSRCASSVDIHGAMSAGEGFEEELANYLKAVALLGVVTGENEIEGEGSDL